MKPTARPTVPFGTFKNKTAAHQGAADLGLNKGEYEVVPGVKTAGKQKRERNITSAYAIQLNG